MAADIRSAAVEEAEADAMFEEWLASVGEGVAGYVTPKVAVAAIVGQRRRRDPAHPARRLGRVAVSGRMGRRGLLTGGDRGEGGLRGDRHRGRGGVARRGVRRSPARLRPTPDVLLALPLPDARRRASRGTRWRRAMWASARAPTRCRGRSPAAPDGSRPRSRRSTANSDRSTSIRPARHRGAEASDRRMRPQPLSSVIVKSGWRVTPMSASAATPPTSRSITQSACSTTPPRSRRSPQLVTT